jgi:LPS export ABC transporter protein LptC
MNRIILRVFFILLLGTLFVEILIIVPSQLNPLEDSTKSIDDFKDHVADQHMEKVHLVESKEGRRDWELYSDTADGFMGKGLWSLTQVKVLFYTLIGDSYTVTGKTGFIDTNSRNIEIKGNVLTQSTNGYEFRSESIYFDSQAKTLTSPEKVKMKGPKDQNGQRLTLSGSNMKTLLDSSLMEINKEVETQRALNSGENMKIQSDLAQFSGKSNMGRFAGQVKIFYNSMLLTGPEATFVYKPGTNLPTSMMLVGGVKVTGDEKIATSENLKVDFENKRYIFRGSPRMVHNGDELIGDEIVFLDGGKRVKVENVKAKVEDIDMGNESESNEPTQN